MTANIRRFEIEPLTKKNSDGETHFRRDITLEQLKALQTAPDGVIERRIGVEQEDEPESLKSEALVFLFRTYKTVDPVLAENIFVTLSLRVRRIAHGFRKTLNDIYDFDDFCADLNIQVLTRIGDVDSEDADFAQASFGQWVKGLALNLTAAQRRGRKKAGISVEIDRPVEEEGDRSPSVFLVDKSISPENMFLLKEALATLSDKHRDAWLLKNLHGWKTGSNDKNEPTIASYFGVSDRTIRNWIDEADKVFLRWREGSVRAL